MGGQAKTLFTALSPCILGGKPGIIQLTVVEEDVAQLLSIGLLEHAKSVIDTEQNVISFKGFGTQDRMNRLSSGHRTVDITKWPGGSFPVPEELAEKFQLSPRAFDLSSPVASGAYMSALRLGDGCRVKTSYLENLLPGYFPRFPMTIGS